MLRYRLLKAIAGATGLGFLTGAMAIGAEPTPVHTPTATSTPVVEQVVDPLRCMSGLNKQDADLLAKLQKELRDIAGLSTTPSDYQKKVRAILQRYLAGAPHETLSSSAQAAAIAVVRKAEIDAFVATMTKAAQNQAFVKAYERYLAASARFVQHRKRFGGGLFSFDGDIDELESAMDGLIGNERERIPGALASTNLSVEQKKELTSKFRAAVQKVYMDGAATMGETQEVAKFFGRPEVAIGTAALIVAVPAGIYVAGTSAVAAAAAMPVAAAGAAATTTVATTTAASALSAATTAVSLYGATALQASFSAMGAGASIMSAINIAKIGSAVSVDVNTGGENAFCALGHEIQKLGPKAVEEVLIGTAVSGGLGAALVLLPAVAVPVIVTTATVGGLGLGAFATWSEGAAAQDLFAQAWDAASDGDADRARALLMDSQKKALNAGIDGVSTVLGGLVAAKNASQLKAGMAEAWTAFVGRGKPIVRASPPSSIDNFRQIYTARSAAEENRTWMRLAEGEGAGEGRSFYNFEQSILKHLNDDALREKDLPTALVNFWRERFRAHLSGTPSGNQVQARYADYKSDRVAMAPQTSEREMNKAYELACRDLDAKVKELGLPFAVPTRDASTWHLGGIGETADEAAIAARMGRTLVSQYAAEGKTVPIQNFKDWIPRLQTTFASVANQRQRLHVAVPDARLWTPVRDPSTGVDRAVPSTRVFEIVRKYASKGDDYLRTAFQARLDVRMTTAQARMFREYVAQVENLVPDVRVAERIRIPMEQAKQGIVSVDFMGQNNRNMFETAAELARTEGAAPQVVVKALRAGERRATQVLNRAKGEMQDIGPSYFSGDDGMMFPEAVLNTADKFRLLSQFSQMETVIRPRVVFVGPRYREGLPIPPAERQVLIVSGERFEKEVHSLLAMRLGDDLAESLTLGIDLLPSSSGGSLGANVLASGSLSAREGEMLRQIVREVGQTYGFTDVQVVLPVTGPRRLPSVPGKLARPPENTL